MALICSSAVFGQINFFNVYTNNGSDQGQGVVQLEDSSYVVTGASSSFSNSSQAFLMHVDSLGNYLWSQNYGGEESESGRRVLYKKNFGFFVCGFTNSIGNGGYDSYLIKTDELGNMEWEKTYGGDGWERVHDAALTRDTGVIMVGETSSNFNNNQDIHIICTDKMGDTIWTKTIGGGGNDYATSIDAFTDSTFVISGQMYVEDSSMTKVYIAYFKDDGTEIWSDVIGDNGNYWSNDFTFNGNQIFGIGGYNEPGTESLGALAYIYDIAGFSWGESKVIANGRQEFINVVNYGPLDEYYITNSSEDDISYENGPDVLVMKYVPTLTFVNSFRIGFPNPDVSGEIIKTNDGGAIAVGFTTGYVSGGNEVYLAKIGPNDDYPSTVSNIVIDNIVTIKESKLDEGIRVYPNPTDGLIHVSTSDPAYEQVRVLNSLGQEMVLSKFQLSTKIDLSPFQAGVYYVELSGKHVSPKINQLIIR